MKPLRIYYDTKLDFRATYTPLVKDRIKEFGWAFNDWFVEVSQK